MQKQKTQTKNSDSASYSTEGLASQIGAWVLTAAALLASVETLHHNDHTVVPVTASAGHSSVNEGMSARAEGTRETARLPEEYDVGLRMPAISGS